MLAIPLIAILIASLTIPDANFSLYFYDKLFSSNQRLKNNFKNKRIWITGASSGIGAEIASQLYDHGAKIIISGRRELELMRQLESILSNNTTKKVGDNESSSDNSNIHVLPFDMTDDEDIIKGIVETAIGHYDGIDILILNAGRGQLSPALDETLSTTKALMDINVIAPIRLALEVIKQDRWGQYYHPHKIDRRTQRMGHIVVTSSVAAKMALPLGTSYASSKHAVHGFFSSLRTEYSDWLRVDLPCPGPIATEFQSKVLRSDNTNITANVLEENHNYGVNDVDDDTQKDDESELKMPIFRCASLIISGMMGPSYIMHETWISRQPTLTFMYLNQYLPSMNNFILSKVGSLRLKAFRANLPLYKVSSWIQAAKIEKEQQSHDNDDDA